MAWEFFRGFTAVPYLGRAEEVLSFWWLVEGAWFPRMVRRPEMRTGSAQLDAPSTSFRLGIRRRWMFEKYIHEEQDQERGTTTEIER